MPRVGSSSAPVPTTTSAAERVPLALWARPGCRVVSSVSLFLLPVERVRLGSFARAPFVAPRDAGRPEGVPGFCYAAGSVMRMGDR